MEGTVTGTVKYVSKFGGIKFVESDEVWYNADNTLSDDEKKTLRDQAQELIGKKATLELNEAGYYTLVLPAGNAPITAYEAEKPEPKMGETPKPSRAISTGQKQGGDLLDESFVTKISGKEFVTFEGLLDVAHKLGLKRIETEMLGHAVDGTTTFKATVVLSDGSSFVGHGDANPKNVGAMIVPHQIRMAETRAVARALRFATNIGMTSSIELGGDGVGDQASE